MHGGKLSVSCRFAQCSSTCETKSRLERRRCDLRHRELFDPSFRKSRQDMLCARFLDRKDMRWACGAWNLQPAELMLKGMRARLLSGPGSQSKVNGNFLTAQRSGPALILNQIMVEMNLRCWIFCDLEWCPRYIYPHVRFLINARCTNETKYLLCRYQTRQ